MKNKKVDGFDKLPSIMKEMRKSKNIVDWSDGTGENFRKTRAGRKNKPANYVDIEKVLKPS